MEFREGSGDPIKSAVIMKIQDGRFVWFATPFRKPRDISERQYPIRTARDGDSASDNASSRDSRRCRCRRSWWRRCLPGRKTPGSPVTGMDIQDVIAVLSHPPFLSPWCPARACIHAESAGSAAGCLDRRRHREGSVGENRHEADRRTVRLRDQQGVAADPAQPRPGGHRLVGKGRSEIRGKNLPGRLRRDSLPSPVRKNIRGGPAEFRQEPVYPSVFLKIGWRRSRFDPGNNHRVEGHGNGKTDRQGLPAVGWKIAEICESKEGCPFPVEGDLQLGTDIVHVVRPHPMRAGDCSIRKEFVRE